MRIITLIVTIFAIVLSLAQAQNYNQFFASYLPYLRPIQAVQSIQAPGGLRDPRSNTGPVLFPPGPPGNPSDTSGVVVGASGYGFVPPNAAFFTYFY